MKQQIQFTVKVHSDRLIENPDGYFYGTFKTNPNWSLVECVGQTMVVESRVFTVEDVKEIEPLFDSITPEMYQSTSRTYRVVS